MHAVCGAMVAVYVVLCVRWRCQLGLHFTRNALVFDYFVLHSCFHVLASVKGMKRSDCAQVLWMLGCVTFCCLGWYACAVQTKHCCKF